MNSADSIIDKGNKVGSLLKLWGSILVSLIVLIISVYNFYITDRTHDRQIEELNLKIKASKEYMKHEFEIYSERSDKRYKRALLIGTDHEERIRTLEKDLQYIKGKENY